jgi:hypothetical protein
MAKGPDFVDEAFDETTFLVAMLVIGGRLFSRTQTASARKPRKALLVDVSAGSAITRPGTKTVL